MAFVLLLVGSIWFHSTTVDHYHDREDFLIHKACEHKVESKASCEYQLKGELEAHK